MDTYWGIYQVSESASLASRMTACAAQQGVADPQPWVWQNRWVYAVAPTWAEKYEYALASDNPDPGADPAVITDADILAQVQKMLGVS